MRKLCLLALLSLPLVASAQYTTGEQAGIFQWRVVTNGGEYIRSGTSSSELNVFAGVTMHAGVEITMVCYVAPDCSETWKFLGAKEKTTTTDSEGRGLCTFSDRDPALAVPVFGWQILVECFMKIDGKSTKVATWSGWCNYADHTND